MKQKPSLNIWMIAGLLSAVCIAVRWFWWIDTYSVNVLYWDQWGFYSVLFNEGSLWDIFSYQHGPHRQGVGFILAKFVAQWSDWDTRVETFVIGTLITVAGLLTLKLKKTLSGNLKAIDWVLFALVLTPAQYGLFVATPNISHGSMPFLLLILYCMTWLIKHPIKYIVLSAITFLMVYTGFGFFIGPISFFLITLDLIRLKQYRLLKIVSLILVLLTFYSFFQDYDFHHPQGLAKKLAKVSFIEYPTFIFVSLANYWSINVNSIWDILFGIFCFVLISTILISSLLKLWKTPRDQYQRVVFILVAFTFIFLINVSFGRTPFGLGGAKASRYIIYITPAFIAVYLYISKLTFGSYFWKLGFTLATLFLSFHTGNHIRKMEIIKTKKQNWVAAYLKTENLEKANSESNFKIHPKPPKVALKKRLKYLKAHQLNLYKKD